MWRKYVLFAMTFAGAGGQVAESRPSFEVASIRDASGQGDSEFLAGIRIQGASVTVREVSLGRLIRAAYGLHSRFLSAPDWVEREPTFDIRATIPNGAPARLVPEMFQGLLEDRFKLKFHLEQKERTVYALVPVEGGPKLQPSRGLDESMPGGAVSGINKVSNSAGGTEWTSPNGSSYRISRLPDGGAELSLSGVSMEEFAFHLNTLDGVDIVDATHLPGKYDFTWTSSWEEECELCPETSRPAGAVRTPSEKESLLKLGLRLEKRRSPVDVFVIENIEKAPTEN